MKKYKIEIYGFNKGTKELEYIETLKTKPVTEEKLKELIIKETSGKLDVCWCVTPRPKGFDIHK